MADIRASFPTTEDSSGNGVAVRSIVEGDPITTINSQPSMIAKDPSNNAIYLKANTQGELVISDETDEDIKLSNSGLLAGTTTEALVASITLQATTDYRKLGWSVNCPKWTLFRIVEIVDVGVTDVETELLTIMVDAGDLQDSNELDNLKFQSGATGTIELQLLAANLSSAPGQTSDMRGAITIGEQQ